ncbi:hypothetical protein J6590_048314 [Homalodisca vitripennis]|nr:hypothetical protein J6590_048314 [Homalodisca vitripennis]
MGSQLYSLRVPNNASKLTCTYRISLLGSSSTQFSQTSNLKELHYEPNASLVMKRIVLKHAFNYPLRSQPIEDSFSVGTANSFHIGLSPLPGAAPLYSLSTADRPSVSSRRCTHAAYLTDLLYLRVLITQ